MCTKHLSHDLSQPDGRETQQTLCGRRVVVANIESRVVTVEVNCPTCRVLYLAFLREQWGLEESEVCDGH